MRRHTSTPSMAVQRRWSITNAGGHQGEAAHGAAMLVKEWAMQHRNELMEDWKLCEQLQTPNKITPLE